MSTPPRPRRRPWLLWAALCLYGTLALVGVRDMGIVGEVAQSWTQGAPARVLVATQPPTWADGAAPGNAGHRAGPLVASQARPIERIQLGPLALPLAVNSYTSGLPDWPARLVWLATGSPAAVVALHVGLGALLIVLVHRFLRFHGTDVAAGCAALFLASDWGFQFYRKALGGTEIALQAAVLLVLWALWSRRWAGGRHGLTAMGIAVGLGLGAKAPFLLSLVALGAVALLTRWDKPSLRPPLPDDLWRPLAWTVGLTAPLWITALHHVFWVPAEPHVVSHDFQGVQLRRVFGAVTGGPAPTREALGNLAIWVGNPLGFFSRAYDATTVPSWTPTRVVGWLLVLSGTVLAWRRRHATPHHALLRFASAFLVFQVGALWLVARDLHHLAQATPILAVVVGLSVDRLAAVASPPRSPARSRWALLLVLPWLIGGGRAVLQTDAVLATVPVPTFTRHGQTALVELLRTHGVQHLVACDYELTGVLEALAPEIEVVHGWGAASRVRYDALPDLLAQAVDGHFLVVESSAAMIYNLQPSAGRLGEEAAALGLRVTEVGRLEGGAAVLYAVAAVPPEVPSATGQ